MCAVKFSYIHVKRRIEVRIEILLQSSNHKENYIKILASLRYI